MSRDRQYVTLFDKNYLTFGLTMYESLQRHSSRPFKLNVVAMDRQTAHNLYGYKDIYVTYWEDLVKRMGIGLDRFKDRTWAQTCWTMASVSLFAALWDHNEATYLDSDLYFFADPELCFEEMEDADVAIVPHNFPAHDAERLRPAGLYNVSWVTARNDEGFTLIGDWFRKVVNKCDAETCGDQRYLDEWPSAKDTKVHVFKSLGMGAGPWNAYTYEVTQQEEITRVVDDRLVFYHFHEFRREGRMNRTGYPINHGQAKLIYEPYEEHFDEVEKRVKSLPGY